MILITAAVLGLVSSAHCVGMCGPLVLLAGGRRHESRVQQLTRAGLYHLGRITTYACLGAAAGMLGHAAASLGIGRAVAIVGGVLLMIAAVASTVTRRHGAVVATVMPVVAGLSHVARVLGNRLPRLGRFVLGAANGLLPCGMVYAALALALTAGSAAQAAAVMATFGAATAPALVATSLAAGCVPARWRQNLRAALPLGLAATGVMLVVRGLSTGCH